MTEWDPPYVEQNADHGSALLRNLLAAQSAEMGAVAGTTDGLKVTQDTGSNMNVKVAAGAAIVAGDEQTNQGAYFAKNDASVTLTHDAAHGTYDRVDVIAARVNDTYYGGATDTWDLEIVKGAEDGSDVAPSLNNNSLKLAEVDIDTGTTAITNALITDKRVEMPGAGLSATAANVPASGQTGQLAWESDTKLLKAYDGSAWVTVGGGDTCSVTDVGTQSIPDNTATILNADTENWDDGAAAMHDTVTNNSRITIATAGLYYCTYTVFFAAGADYGYRGAGFYVDGAFVNDGQQQRANVGSAAYAPSLNGSVLISLAAGSYVEVYCAHDNTANAARTAWLYDFTVTRLQERPS